MMVLMTKPVADPDMASNSMPYCSWGEGVYWVCYTAGGGGGDGWGEGGDGGAGLRVFQLLN